MIPPVRMEHIGEPVVYTLGGMQMSGYVLAVDVRPARTRAVLSGPFGPVEVEYPHG